MTPEELEADRDRLLREMRGPVLLDLIRAHGGYASPREKVPEHSEGGVTLVRFTTKRARARPRRPSSAGR